MGMWTRLCGQCEWWHVLLAVALWLAADALYRWPRVSAAGTTVVVAGAGTGIGAELVRHLHARGVHVLAGCLLDAEVDAFNAEFGAAARKRGSRSRAFALDVTRDESVAAAVQRVTAHLADIGGGARLHAVVCNQGINDGVALELTPVSVYERLLSVNFVGHVRMSKAFVPLLRAGGPSDGPKGRLVLMASMAGINALPNGSAYHSSKFAIEGFGDAVRMELAPFGVRVLMVQPGATATPLLQHVLRQPRVCFERSPPAVRDVYGEQYIADLERLYALGPRFAQSPAAVVRAYDHALFAAHPRDRYLVGVDAWCWAWAFAKLPSWLTDPLNRAILGTPKPVALRRK